MSSITTSNFPALVVGTGFGCRIHVPALQAAGFDVVGIVGTDAERTASRAGSVGVELSYTDLGEAITRTGAVAVTIATPPASHAALTLTAIAHGCHVLCEKPMAMNLDEARNMLQAAEEAGVTHLIANEFRWQPDRAIIARALEDGLIGEPRLLNLSNFISLVASPDSKMPHWWFDPSAGGGWLGAQGSHQIDMVRTWLGEFESLGAALPIVSDRKNVAEDSYVLRFRMKNGAEGILQQTAGAWGPIASMTRVAGTRGTLWVDNGAVHIADCDGARELPVPADLALPEFPVSDDEGHRYSHLLGPFIRLCEALKAGVDGRPANSAVALPTFRDGVACMEVMDAIRTSAANNGALVSL